MDDGRIDLWSSHLPVLVEAVTHTEGPVLELGCGHYSTPILHVLCHDRRLVTVDWMPGWIEKFPHLQSDRHQLLVTRDLRPLAEGHWAVVFVDGRPDYERPEQIGVLRATTDLFVVNNTEPGHPDYRHEEILPSFPYRFDCKRHPVWTSVVSDRPLPEWVGRTV